MGDQGVEAIGEIQDLGVTAALGHCLEGKGTGQKDTGLTQLLYARAGKWSLEPLLTSTVQLSRAGPWS